MDRINTSTKSENLFGAGKHGWKNGNVGLGIVPTDFNAEWFNGVQEELLKIIESAGIVPDGATHAQVYQAIEQLIAEKALPPGAIIDHGGATAPAGYLACPTSATNLSRVTYASLFSAIGVQWGAGDGVTTFGMPWYPANYASVQASGNVGTHTVGDNLAHTHSETLAGLAGNNGGAGPGTNELPIVGTTGSSGGAANLAAGSRVLKCVKY
ncbi:phage tail protein [Polaromonas sp.]|uniref:phage tail protein n=1 Tax=Polaromonas sp. TaxID=1869339 RepID=UPI00272F1B20|nr:phage tail protein [Polaromonas sp.]MDP1887946.1 phage tail protein [Polaromonas sp.]